MVAIWVGALVLFLFIEAQSAAVVSLWFAIGALAAGITALCNGAVWLQVVLFVVVSAISLACMRPIIRKYFTPKLEKTNIDAIIGTVGPVTEDIDNVQALGRVKLGGMEWSARSTNGESIEKGALIRVDRIEGVKVFVTKK